MDTIDNPVSLTLEPSTALIDEEIKIIANGFRPHHNVTFVAQTQDRNTKFYSNASFVADASGVVDVSQVAPVAGRYKGIMPMGLFCSLIQEPGQAPGRRLVKRDVTTPLTCTLVLLEGHVTSEEEVLSTEREVIATCTCERWYMGPGVERHPIRHHRLKGTMFIPPGDGPFPGILDLFGTIGGTVEHRAALLASRGFVTLALQYFNPYASFKEEETKDEGLISDLEYFVSAVDMLYDHQKAVKTGVGVIGTSKGAEMAYLTSVCSEKIRACITIGGSLFNQLIPHTYQGHTFPTFEHSFELMMQKVDGAIIFKDSYIYARNNKLIPEETFIPIEKSKNAHFLVLHGEDDQSSPPFAIKDVPQRLKDHGKSNCETVLYPGTGHILEPPYSPLAYCSFHAMFDSVCIWGGEVEAHSAAQKDSWMRIQTFLKSRLCPAQNEGIQKPHPAKL